MFGVHDYWLFVLSAVLLNIAPGQDTIYILGRSIGQGRRIGVASALGVSAGTVVHTFAAALGLSAIVAASATAFLAMKLIGAAYLVYLGIALLRASMGPAPTKPAKLPRVSYRRVFTQGLLTNVLNPKVALFFLAFLPQFADPARGAFALQVLVLGLIFIVNGLWVCLLVARSAAAMADWARERAGAMSWIQRGSGALLVGLGLHLAINGRQA